MKNVRKFFILRFLVVSIIQKQFLNISNDLLCHRICKSRDHNFCKKNEDRLASDLIN